MKTGKVLRAAGFTLLEVVCALAILIGLFGGVYGIASGALQLSRASGETLLRELQLNHLDAMLRSALEALPGSTQFELESGEAGEQLTLITEKGSAPLRWQNEAALAERVVFRLEPDPDREGRERLALEHWTTSGAGRLERIGNLRLPCDWKSARWRLFDPRADRWVESWAMQDGRPLFVELTHELAGQPGVRRSVFWLPPYATPVPVSAPNPPAR